ncbi:TerD family protein [Paenibacillus agricola]|uniref:TerD family protein n=1 Tax=Paenibacillus agricola TaxID=2716264 RepID=A0ABX0J980_9BACL|nr:TerD family protein [Paenibacillus agricola]NHN32960.1 TerD family protein [Paenibacillus agricola]
MANPITTLLTGANAPLAKEKMLEVTIEWTDSPADLDVSCFLIGESGKVPSDEYFIFYNQPADPGFLVEYKGTTGNRAVFSINLEGLLATEINKCVFAATLDGPGTFKTIKGCKITARTSQADVVYEIKEAGDETSLVFLELYRHQAWLKVRAIGKGFNGGLQPLAEAHGVSVAEEEAEPAEPAASAAAPAPRPAAAASGVPAASAGGAASPASSPAASRPATPASANAPASNAAPAAASAGVKPASVFAKQQATASVFASQQPSDSVFAKQPATASIFASQQSAASVFASQPKRA